MKHISSHPTLKRGLFVALAVSLLVPAIASASDFSGSPPFLAISADMQNFKKVIAFGLGAIILVIGTFMMGGTVIEGGKEVAEGRYSQGLPKIGIGLAIIAAAVILPAGALKVFGLSDAAINTSDITSALNQ